jgi:hypothetical protein
MQNLTVSKIENGQPRVVLNNETINVRVNGKASMPKGGPTSADLSDLAVTSSSNLINVSKGDDRNITVTLPKAGGFSGNGTLKIASDLKRLNDLAQSFSSARPASAGRENAGQLTSGILDATVKLDHPVQQKATTLALDGTINNLSVTTNAEPIQNEKVTISLSAVSPDDLTKEKLTISKCLIDSTFARTTLGETVVDLNATNALDKLVKSDLDIVSTSLPRLYALYQAFVPPQEPQAQPAAAKMKKGAVAEAAPTTQPLRVTSGGAEIKLHIAHDANSKLIASAPRIAVTKLGLARGNQTYKMPEGRSLNLTFAAEAAAANDKLNQLRFTQLGGDLGVAKLEMPEPIVITNLDTQPAASGTVKLTGAIQEVTPMLAVLQGKPAMTYAGKYDLTQKIATQQDQVTLLGNISVPDFQTDANAKAQNLSVKNDVVADMKNKNATINALSVSMPDTKALSLDLKGKVLDWAARRQFDGLVMNLSYDLAQLWPIVKPMLSPEQQEKYKDLKISGQYAREFHVTGSYPADKEFAEAIKTVQADGAISVAQLETSGMNPPDHPEAHQARDVQQRHRQSRKCGRLLRTPGNAPLCRQKASAHA